MYADFEQRFDPRGLRRDRQRDVWESSAPAAMAAYDERSRLRDKAVHRIKQRAVEWENFCLGRWPCAARFGTSCHGVCEHKLAYKGYTRETMPQVAWWWIGADREPKCSEDDIEREIADILSENNVPMTCVDCS